MRRVFSLVLLAGVSSLLAQDPKEPDEIKEPEPRFGIGAKLKVYPQHTAKKTLASSLVAIEKGDIAYLLAHLLEPKFVELRLADRAREAEPAVELELSNLRTFQIRNRDKFKPEDRLPVDPVKFRALVVQRAREQGFKQLVRDVELKLLNDPQSLREMRRILTDGMFADIEGGAKGTHPDVKDRSVFFRKIEDRWFLENRQEELPAPKKEP